MFISYKLMIIIIQRNISLLSIYHDQLLFVDSLAGRFVIHVESQISNLTRH